MNASLREIARALGGVVCGSSQVLAPGPGHGPHDRSLSVRLSASSPNGFIVFSHAGDDWRACRDYVRERLGLSRDVPRHERPIPKAKPTDEATDAKRIGDALSLWSQGVDPRGTLAERYLNGRALQLSDDIAGDVIRWHAGVGAMLALFRDIHSDEPKAVSRTFLDREGRKLERRFLGPVGGRAVKLDADDTVLEGLHVGEGVETCLAARQLDLKPCWALGSKGAIGAFPVLSGVECLTILAERDAEREVEACAARWHEVGREVLITRTVGGKDANDVLNGARP